MGTTVTQPRAGIPIGTVEINRVQYEVTTNPEFVRFFTSLVARNGGVVSLSLTEVQALAESALSRAAISRPVLQQLNVRPGEFVSIAQDAAGYVVNLDMASIINAVRAYSPRPAPPPPPNDAQAILAGRVFSH